MDKDTSLVNRYTSQYAMLREEMASCTKLVNEFSTFSFTALSAVLAFSFSVGDALLFLVPFVFIIPLSSKTLYYRKNVAKISAYMIAVLEPDIPGYSWETDNLRYREEKRHQRFSLFRNYEYGFEALVCLVLYLCYASIGGRPSLIAWGGALVGAVAFGYVAVTSYMLAHTGGLKNVSIKKWRAVKAGR